MVSMLAVTAPEFSAMFNLTCPRGPMNCKGKAFAIKPDVPLFAIARMSSTHVSRNATLQ
jgi:hypothetical protein